MSAKDRIKKLSEHYKVPQGTYNLQEWSGAIKRAANKTLTGAVNMSLEVLYDRTFNKTSAATAITQALPKKDEPEKAPKADVVAASAVEVIPPGSTHNHRIDIGQPAIHMHVPPAVVHVPAVVDLRPAELALRFGAYVFVFCSGVMLGILIATPMLKRLAITVAGG